MKHIVYIFYFLWPVCLFAGTNASNINQEPSDTLSSASQSARKVDINLRTQGGLQVVGTSQTKAAMRLASQSANLTATQANTLGQDQTTSVFVVNTTTDKKLDTLLYRLESMDGLHVFSKESDAIHQKLQLALPDSYQLSSQIEKGEVSLSGVNATVDLQIGQGNLSASQLQGYLYASLQEGNCTISNATLEGNLFTQKGDILLSDVSGMLQASSQNGKVLYQYSPAFLSQKGSGFRQQILLGDLQIGSLPVNASFVLEKGNVHIDQAKKNVDLAVKEGNIAISSALGSSVSAVTEKGNITYTLSSVVSEQNLILVTDQGDIILTLPSGFDGSVQVHLIQTSSENTSSASTLAANTALASEWEMGTVQEEIQQGATGQILAKESHWNRVGSGKITIYLKATNGKIYLKKG
ncbi:hypothetical protein QNI19_12245 [Cytophagaceae bacterium DM2B3-1]|uniref:Adhesin domain-containing protein n=1 Tax=Xanthocytophaga flava TaxID=3048013 RepID=A0ABT7CM28_9BACT|nr:hypothetical protein [Xanthocytophaga flavus]MDJ1493704.1 hypothetical protein [Xanthocytophaga flavus]